MSMQTGEDSGPDLTQGVTLADFDGRQMLRGHVGKEAVLLARVGAEVLAVGAVCTHYSGPLAEGIVVGDTVRCPWHHACFSLRTGEALGAPAFDPVACWQVERVGERFVVRQRREPAPEPARVATAATPRDVVIVGGGAAGFACAEMLRRRGYRGRLTMLSDDADPPCDRPNLSKDFLAGTAPAEWIPLRADDFYAQNEIDLRLRTAAARLDLATRTVTTDGGDSVTYDRLLLATGAEPVRLPIPGAEQAHVCTLRSLADARAIAARAGNGGSAVILGSGFIGLEAAAALRARGVAVHVVSLDERPLGRILGPEFGDFLRALHESHGVTFHLRTSLAAIGEQGVTLSSGVQLPADFVIIGVGVRPRVALAEAAGIPVDHGILVDEYLETSTAGVFAAGDVARWRDAGDGEMRRIEHWVVAERQGQLVAENMLGARRAFRDTPFFWSAHYDLAIRYVGHGAGWDTVEIDGNMAARDCLVRYSKHGKLLAVATIGRDAQALAYGAQLAGET